MDEQIRGSHKLNLTGRGFLSMTGVQDVLSFDANEIILETTEGVLVVRGTELHVNKLTLEKGEVEVDGLVQSLIYSDNTGGGKGKSGQSFFGKLFQ